MDRIHRMTVSLLYLWCLQDVLKKIDLMPYSEYNQRFIVHVNVLTII